MTDNQKRFCEEYLIDRNATQAALRAGYARNTAERASDWINPEGQEKSSSKFKPELREYIDKQLAAMKADNIADAQEVMSYITSVMRAKHEETRNRIKAAELMGKRYGLFRDNISVTGAIPVVIDGGDDLED